MAPPDDLDGLSHAELKGLVVKQWEQIVELQRMVWRLFAMRLLGSRVGRVGRTSSPAAWSGGPSHRATRASGSDQMRAVVSTFHCD